MKKTKYIIRNFVTCKINQDDILYGRYNQVVSPFHLAKKNVILTDSKT